MFTQGRTDQSEQQWAEPAACERDCVCEPVVSDRCVWFSRSETRRRHSTSAAVQTSVVKTPRLYCHYFWGGLSGRRPSGLRSGSSLIHSTSTIKQNKLNVWTTILTLDAYLSRVCGCCHISISIAIASAWLHRRDNAVGLLINYMSKCQRQSDGNMLNVPRQRVLERSSSLRLNWEFQLKTKKYSYVPVVYLRFFVTSCWSDLRWQTFSLWGWKWSESFTETQMSQHQGTHKYATFSFQRIVKASRGTCKH